MKKKDLNNKSKEDLLEIIGQFEQEKLMLEEQNSHLEKTKLNLQQEKLNLEKEKSDLEKTKITLLQEKLNLEEENRLLRAELFGRSSEKIIELDKLNDKDKIFDEAEAAASCSTNADENQSDADIDLELDKEPQTSSSPKEKKPKRKKLPENLPREVIEIDLADNEKACDCGCDKKIIGEEVTEKLEVIPAKAVVLRYVRKKYACKNCEEGVSIPPLPNFFLPKSIASTGLVAQTITNKYARHLPLYRQEDIWRSFGVALSRSTTCNWIMLAYEACKPLIEVMKAHLIKQHYLQADETPTQVLNEADRKDTQTSYMWVYQSMIKDNRLVLFDYQQTRGSDNPKKMLSNFHGFLQTDAYKGYDWVNDNENITQLGCMTHARRPFAEIAKSTKKVGKSHQAIAYFKKLYAIEKKAKKQKLSANERHALRIKEAKPILDDLKKWAEKSLPNAAPGSKLQKAFNYLLNHWDKLTNYLKDGRLEIDNNSTEREIRPFALGKKNWLFLGSPRGAHASAFFYSLIGSAKLNNLEPYDYLKHVFDNIRNCKTTAQLEALLPFNCQLPKKNASS